MKANINYNPLGRPSIKSHFLYQLQLVKGAAEAAEEMAKAVEAGWVPGAQVKVKNGYHGCITDTSRLPYDQCYKITDVYHNACGDLAAQVNYSSLGAVLTKRLGLEQLELVEAVAEEVVEPEVKAVVEDPVRRTKFFGCWGTVPNPHPTSTNQKT